jgi:GT2 family glycosyltransferase
MNDMLDLAVSIVSTDDADILKKCLQALQDRISNSLRYEIYVVDNASANEVSVMLKEGFPLVKVIRNKKRKGFSENHNKVIDSSASKYVLILNPDVIINDGYVEHMIGVMMSDNRVGCVSGKLLRLDGKTIDSTGHIIFKNRTTADRGQNETDTGQYDEQEEVFSNCAAAMLCRRETLEDIRLFGEYFDESFCLYKEDIDLCWRARLRGWKIVYDPKAIAYHLRGWGKDKTRRSIPRFIRRHSYKNRYLMILKDDHFANVFKHLPYILWHEIKAFVYVIFREPHLILAWGQLLMLLPLTLRKRFEIMRRAVVGPEEIRKWFV